MQQQECESGLGWAEIEIPSSDPSRAPYKVLLAPWGDGLCDCPSFEYRGWCRHVREATARRCTWKSEDGPQQTPEQSRYYRCPLCEGRTRTVVYLDDE